MTVFLKKIFSVRLLTLAAIFLAGFFISSYFGGKSAGSAVSEFHPIRPANTHYEFINPLVGFDISESQDFPDLVRIKSKIVEYLEKKKKEKKIDSAAVYYRNPENGHWIGINEDEEYDAASLLKVPVMIAYLKRAETRPEVLQEKIIYAPTNAVKAQNGNVSSALRPGRAYTVEELIREMIVASDNEAKNLLLGNIDERYILDVYSDLGIPIEGEPYKISARTYARFIRRLYNATFLSREMSERALGLLTETAFKDGLVAGTPPGIKIAHKFGERALYDRGDLLGVEFHDCGIIYHPGQPRLLCVMTRGTDLLELEKAVRDIAQFTYLDVLAGE